jgi:hypothetical protein
MGRGRSITVLSLYLHGIWIRRANAPSTTTPTISSSFMPLTLASLASLTRFSSPAQNGFPPRTPECHWKQVNDPPPFPHETPPASSAPPRETFILHPSSFILHPSSFILHPSSFILHPSSFLPLPQGGGCEGQFLAARAVLGRAGYLFILALRLEICPFIKSP